ncbi:PRC-barrel domain-containing protein [Actinophytocola sp. NPDC049390]|uniref:PRC-barrel domain-containing protein n=1 Tax=Actinophytocola sp. NPDC049390 TaxID=3363894 RepID=UPI0037B1349D
MNGTAPLVRLGDTELTLAERDEDVRGRDVLDPHDDKVGEVDDLIIDHVERRVRFLDVGAGGFLGLGKDKVLIPVDAVTSVADTVHVDTEREHVAGSPAYDPDLVLDRTSTASFYDYYGYVPYWHMGYMNPGFPYRAP